MNTAFMKKYGIAVLVGILGFSLPDAGWGQTGGEVIRRAEELERAGRVDEACSLYETVNASDPNQGVVFQRLKDLYIRTNRLDKALFLVENQSKRMPDDLGLQSCVGEILWRRDRKQDARDVWNNILDRNSRSLSAYQIVASSMTAVKLFDEAIGVYMSGREKMGKKELFALNLETLFASRMDYENAAEELIVFLEANPTQVSFVENQFARYPRTDRVMGDILEKLQNRNRAKPGNPGIVQMLVSMNLQSDRYEEARRGVEEVERSSSAKNRGMATFRFGQELEKRGAMDAAVDVYLGMVQQFSDFSLADQIWIHVARCHERQGRYPEAVNAYEIMIEKYPKSTRIPEALFDKGSIESENLFQWSDAENTFLRIIQNHPSSKEYADAWLRLGDCRIHRGDLDGADSVFMDLLRQQKKKGVVWLKTQIRLANVSFLKQDFGKGVQWLEPLVHEKIEDDGYGDPDFNDGMKLMLFIKEFMDSDSDGLRLMARADFFIRQRLTDQALAVLDTLCSRKPSKPIRVYAFFKMGILQAEMGRFRDAQDKFQKVFGEFPSNPLADDAKERMGWIYETIGDRSRAMDMYESLLVSYPHSDLAGDVRRRMQRIEKKQP